MHCGGCLRSVERAALKVPGVRTARASLAAKRVSIVYDPDRAGAGDVIDALQAAGFAAAAIEAGKQNRDDARQNYLLRRVAVAGFAAMNIMLISIAVWSGEASDMDPALASAFRWVSALIALPTVAYAGQPFFGSALGALKGRRLNMDVPISLAILLATGMSLYQTLRGGQQVYFDAAVSLLFFLLVGRFLDETLRVRARGEAQNLAQLTKRDGHRHRAWRRAAPGPGACASSRRSPARFGWREGRRRRRGAGRDGTGRSKPDHRRDGAADRDVRGRRSMPARSI